MMDEGQAGRRSRVADDIGDTTGRAEARTAALADAAVNMVAKSSAASPRPSARIGAGGLRKTALVEDRLAVRQHGHAIRFYHPIAAGRGLSRPGRSATVAAAKMVCGTSAPTCSDSSMGISKYPK